MHIRMICVRKWKDKVGKQEKLTVIGSLGFFYLNRDHFLNFPKSQVKIVNSQLRCKGAEVRRLSTSIQCPVNDCYLKNDREWIAWTLTTYRSGNLWRRITVGKPISRIDQDDTIVSWSKITPRLVLVIPPWAWHFVRTTNASRNDPI